MQSCQSSRSSEAIGAAGEGLMTTHETGPSDDPGLSRAGEEHAEPVRAQIKAIHVS